MSDQAHLTDSSRRRVPERILKRVRVGCKRYYWLCISLTITRLTPGTLRIKATTNVAATHLLLVWQPAPWRVRRGGLCGSGSVGFAWWSPSKSSDGERVNGIVFIVRADELHKRNLPAEVECGDQPVVPL